MPPSPSSRFMFRFIMSAAMLFAVAERASSEEHSDYGRRVEADQRLKTLEMLTTKMQQNHERIKSWSGSYEATSRIRVFRENPSLPANQRTPTEWASGGQPLDRGTIQTGPTAGDGYWNIRKGIVRFSLNVAEKKCHVFYDALDSMGFLDVPTGTEMRSTQPGESMHWIITDDSGVEFDTLRLRTRLPEFLEIDPIRSGRVLYRRPRLSRGGFMVDPRDFLSTGNFAENGRFAWRHTEAFSRMLRGEVNQLTLDLTQEKLAIYVSAADPPTYTVVLPYGKGQLISQYDGKAGFNLTRDHQTYDTGQTLNTTVYREISGTHLPDKIERQHFVDVPEGDRRYDAKNSYQLLKTELNQPIPPDEFEVTSLCLTYGDRLFDEIQKKLYFYDDRIGFVLASEFTFDPSRVKKPEPK